MRSMLAMLLLLGACAGTEVREVTGPSGDRVWAIRCKQAIDCMELAGETCPNGYVTIDRISETRGGIVSSQGTAVGSVWTIGTNLIECRGENPNEIPHPKDKGPRCGYTCGPQVRECPWLDWHGCYEAEYDVPAH